MSSKEKKKAEQSPEQNTLEKTEEMVSESKEMEVEAEVISPFEAQLKEQTLKAEEYLKAAQMVQADFDNYRRRNQKAIAEAIMQGQEKTLLQLLPILDNLERALVAAATSKDGIFEGVEKIAKQFKDTLQKMEVTPIEALGQPFDPNIHHAIMQEEAKEESQKGLVVEEFQKGYLLGQKVIRYSMVKVVN